MEIPQSLAIESFSQSWLTSLNSSSLHGLGRPSLDHHNYKNGLNFNFPISQASDDVYLVHADQLFSDGLIRPADFSTTPINSIQAQATPAFSTTPTSLIQAMPTAASRSSNIVPTIQIQCNLFRRWRKQSVQIFVRCFEYLIRPVCLQLQVRHSIKGSSIVDDNDWMTDSPASYSRADFCDVNDNPIDEAVLHCKRSILDK